MKQKLIPICFTFLFPVVFVWAETPAPTSSLKNADYSRGLAQYESKNYTEAFKSFQKAAEAGDARGENKLGELYSAGQGVEQDLVKAAQCYQKASDHGDLDGESNLGAVYLNGKGVKQDTAKAVKLFEKGAARGYSDDQVNMAYLYEDGIGVKKSEGKALALFKQAAGLGNAHAENYLVFPMRTACWD